MPNSISKTVDVIFNGVDKTSRGVDSVLNNIQNASGRVQAVAQPFADLTTTILKLEAAVALSGAALTAYAIKTAGDFDTSFREISTLISEPSGELDKFRQSVLEYGKDSTQSLNSVTGAVYSAISAGTDYTNSLDIVRQAEQLAVGGKADLNESLVVLVSSLNAYGDGADQAQAYSDALFTTVKLGQTTLPELASSLAQVTGIAASGGVLFDELLAAIATLTATGLPTAQSVTAIRGAIAALLKPTKEASDTAAELNIKFDAQALKAKGLTGVLDDVKTATGGNTEQMAKLFGSVEALNGVLVLTGKGADKFADNLEAFKSKVGATDEAFTRMAGSVDLESQKIQNALKGILIAVGDPLLNEYGDVGTAISEIFNVISSEISSGKLEGFVSEIEGVGEHLVETLRKVAANLPEALAAADYSGFMDGLDALRESVESLFSGVDLSSAEGLQKVIKGTGDAFETFINFTAGVGDAIGPVVGMLVDLVAWFRDLSDGTKQTIGVVGGMAVVLDSLAPSVTAVAVAMLALNSSGLELLIWSKALPALLGKAGVAGGVIAAGVGLGVLIEKSTGLGSAINDRLVPGVDTLGTKLYDWINGNEEVEKSLTSVSNSADKFNDAIDDVPKYVFDAKESNELLALAMKEVSASMKETGLHIDPLTGKVQELALAENTAALALTDAVDKRRGYTKTIQDGIVTFTQYGDAGSYAFKKVTDATKKAVTETESFQAKMEEIASDERIKNIEAFVTLNVAQLETDSKRAIAIIDGINQTIKSTGDVISSGLDALSGVSGSYAHRQLRVIEEQLDAEKKYRKEALDEQKKLTAAEVDLLRAKKSAVERGDSIIKVDGSGLAPHLEAFMWETLKAIQVRANADGAEFLLGLNQ